MIQQPGPGDYPNRRCSALPDAALRQAAHDQAQAEDPDHDLSSCWCCCVDCDGDYDR